MSALPAVFSPIVPAVPRIGEDEPPPSWDPVLTPEAMVGRASPKLSMIPKGSPKIGRMLAATSGRMKKVSPQSRLSKKTANSPKVNQVKQRAIWNAELEKSLADILFEYKDTGYRGDNGWSSEGWNQMLKEFHIRNKYVSFTRKQVQEKETQLKKDYKMLKEARKQSGASWNEKRCMVEASPALWENLKITFPKIIKFRNNKASFPLYDVLGEIYDGHLAEGKHNCTSLDSMEDEEPLRLVQELEEAELEETDVVLLEDPKYSGEQAEVMLPEEEKDLREEDNDQRNPRQQGTQADGTRAMTEEQRRQALIQKRRQEKEDKKAKKASQSSRVESMMERYIDLKSKQAEDEAADRAKEKEAATVNDFSITRCISVLSTMDVTKEEKAKAFQVFIKSKENRETFLSGCELDQDATLMWLKSVMV